MGFLHHKAWLLVLGFLWVGLCGLVLPIAPAWGQDSSADPTLARGNRAEISITVRDSGGEPISAPVMVKIFRSGMPSGQAATSKGRAFFILSTLGEYTVVVDAPGYKSVQRDLSIQVAVKAEVDIYLQHETATKSDSAVPGGPLLAPKAKEAFDKALQALSESKLDAADKYIAEAMKLAPGHPDVLYVQGVLYLRRQKWTQAQGVFEKATQIDPNHSHAFAALGMALANQGKYDQAIAPLEKSLQLDSTGSWETRWTLGKAYYHQQEYGEALKTSQEALEESHGAAPDIELLVAQSFTAVGRFDDAANSLRDYIKNHGDQPGAVTAKKWLDRLVADGKIKRQ